LSRTETDNYKSPDLRCQDGRRRALDEELRKSSKLEDEKSDQEFNALLHTEFSYTDEMAEFLKKKENDTMNDKNHAKAKHEHDKPIQITGCRNQSFYGAVSEV
jgi:hypothetical protein